jgi:hypothetical protein
MKVSYEKFSLWLVFSPISVLKWSVKTLTTGCRIIEELFNKN